LEKKKVEDADALAKIWELVEGIEVPVSSIVREDAGISAHQVVKATEEVQELVTSEAGSLLMVAAEEVQEENVDASKAGVSEATRGNPDSPHNANVIVVESSSTTSSQSTSSSDIDDVPLKKIYGNLHKALSPSPSTKLHKKPAHEEYVPVYPQIMKSIGEMSEMRNKIYERIPANHPYQPPMIEPLSFIPADAEVVSEQVGFESANLDEPSSHPNSSPQTKELSVLENLVSHYSGELPGVEFNLEKASEVASSEVALESPQQQALNVQMASTICPEVSISEQCVPEQLVSSVHIESLSSIEKVGDPDFMITSEDSDVEAEQSNSSSTVVITYVTGQSLETNTRTTTSTNDP
jgi:hypothetical protein